MIAKDVIIIGNGLFGSIAATYARHRGHNVTVVSDMQPLAASKASGCVLAPSWLTSLAAGDVDLGMGLLRDLYDVQDVAFESRMGISFKAQRIDPDSIMVKPDVMAKVDTVRNGSVVLANGDVLKGLVYVAAGIWAGELVEMPKIRGLYGASVRFQAHLPTPKINVYAPYKQSVGFQLNKKEVWFGDGTALVQKTWESTADGRIDNTVNRGLHMLGEREVKVRKEAGLRLRVVVGARPYVEGHKAGYFDRVSPHTWVATGGAKNGTVLAAVHAARFIAEARL